MSTSAPRSNTTAMTTADARQPEKPAITLPKGGGAIRGIGEKFAAKDIEQIDQQIAAAGIRKALADSEKKNHLTQTENAQEVEAFLRDKYTNQELYGWMMGQVARVYFQTYQLAYDVPKGAEAAYRYQLGIKDSGFIQFGYWDRLKKGLLAGEKRHHDLKRLELTYLEQNRREYEITRHISLGQLDPMALIQLKQTGECFVFCKRSQGANTSRVADVFSFFEAATRRGLCYT